MHHSLITSAACTGDLVAVQGVGGLGHLAIQYARAMGFRVAAIARGRDKKELALKLGAHHYIDSTASDPAQALQELGGAKVVLATAGSGASMSPLIGGLAVRGQLVVVGEALEVLPQSPHHPNLPTVLNVPMGGFNLVAS
ncbi:zinc-binding dehydrogenase [Streptomyces rochei]|uniref:zinc-binding dehydrogenase n=1 Tax=Streptomyces TaxID=1883 RepID=UPI00198B2984|nr:MULTISPECIES: zinc-binding dehydrogenase [unclassified Streptomyces]GGY97949.1 hypothetical protein GCM10010385_54810 [Streptomyces geysiriensis]